MQSTTFLLAGLALAGAGLALSERTLGRLLSPDGHIEATGTRLKILLLELLLVAGGAALVALRHRLQLRRGAALLLLASAAFSLLAAEGLLRAAGHRPWSVHVSQALLDPPGPFLEPHPELGYTHRPGRVQVTLEGGLSFQVTHDEDGFRITAPPGAEPGPAREELWILGCSFTHGWSLNDAETYPWLLQERIPEIRARNLGVGGYGTLQSLILLRERPGRRPPPRAVLLAYADFHDRRSVMSRARRREMVPRNLLGPLTQSIARLSDDALVVDLAPLVYREFPLQRRSALVARIEEAYSDVEERLLRPEAVTRAIVREVRDLAAAHGAVLLLAGITDSAATRRLLESAGAAGIPTAEISVDLKIPEHTNLPHDHHPSALANRRYAEKLEPFLRRELSLALQAPPGR